MQVAAQHAGLVASLDDMTGRVGRDQRGVVGLEVDRREVAAQVGRVGTVLRGQTGHQERDLGLLRVSRETDEGAADVRLETSGLAQVCPAVLDRGQAEVALGGREAGDLGAELLDRAHAEAVLLLQAAKVVGIVDAGALWEAREDGLVERDRAVKSVNEELEVPGELHDLVVGVSGCAR